mmetsp:Transcript_67154/g.186010  ORF Transcript_67154/g.186010 Transcript_67154/m.186010 type:complete len:271 (+) Transcript_67154:543-1355(+)
MRGEQPALVVAAHPPEAQVQQVLLGAGRHRRSCPVRPRRRHWRRWRRFEQVKLARAQPRRSLRGVLLCRARGLVIRRAWITLRTAEYTAGASLFALGLAIHPRGSPVIAGSERDIRQHRHGIRSRRGQLSILQHQWRRHWRGRRRGRGGAAPADRRGPPHARRPALELCSRHASRQASALLVRNVGPKSRGHPKVELLFGVRGTVWIAVVVRLESGLLECAPGAAHVCCMAGQSCHPLLPRKRTTLSDLTSTTIPVAGPGIGWLENPRPQ